MHVCCVLLLEVQAWPEQGMMAVLGSHHVHVSMPCLQTAIHRHVLGMTHSCPPSAGSRQAIEPSAC